MRASGSITADQYEDALSERVELKPGRVFTEVKESLFVQYVTDTLIREYGVSFVRSGGLKIYTTIDPRLQDFAEQAIHGRLNVTGDPAATLVAIDPRTGAIRAMVQAQTGVRERSIQFNYATRGLRQSGSAFKTFVLTEAVRRGIDPYTTLYRSAPFVYQPVPDIEPWAPRTFDNRYAGDVTIANATVRSDNAVYARLTLDLGPESIVKIARRMGVTTSPLRPVPSIGLGSNDVTVLEMASAYATLSAGGVYIQPRAIRKIVRDGAVYDQDTWTKPKRKRVFLDGVAETVTRILESNVQGGTGTSANLGNGWRVAGKTGTTDEFTDAWFCGYTPVLATAVWVGYPQGKIEMTNVHGRAVSGGSFPAEIWRDFMQRALSGIRIRDFAPARKFPAEISWKGQYQQVGDLPETSTDETETAETETASGPPGAPGEQAPEQPAAPPAEPAPPQPAAPPPPEQPAPPPEQPAPPPAEPVPPAPAPPPAPPPPAEPAPPQPAPPSPGEPPPTTT
jgi:penicillin-binding protein 1A